MIQHASNNYTTYTPSGGSEYLPSYNVINYNPDNQSTSVTVSTSTQIVQWSVPSGIFNFGLDSSGIRMKVSIADPADTVQQHLYAHPFSMFQSLDVRTESGQVLVSLPSLYKYSYAVIRREITIGELMSLPIPFLDTASASNDKGIWAFCHRNFASIGHYRNVASGRSLTLGEPMEFASGNAVNLVTAVDCFIPFWLLKNTLLSANMDLYVPENTIWSFTFLERGRSSMTTSAVLTAITPTLYWVSQSAISVTDGVVDITVSNLHLELSRQSNAKLNEKIKSAFMGGLKVCLPYIHQQSASLTGTSQLMDVNLNSGVGSHLKKLFYTAFATSEASSSATQANIYDNNGLADAKIQVHYLTLNTLDAGNYTSKQWDISASDDYNHVRNQLVGKAISVGGSYAYYANHCISYDFTAAGSHDLFEGYPEDRFRGGIPLASQVKMTFNNTTTSGSFTHFVWAVVSRTYSIDEAGLIKFV